MKKLLFLTAGFLIAFSLQVSAQEKNLTADDAAYQNPAIFPAYMQQLQWLGATDNFVYAKNKEILKENAKTSKVSKLFDLSEFNNDLKKANIEPLKNLAKFTFVSPGQAIFSLKGIYYNYDYLGHQITKFNQIPDTAQNEEMGPAHKMIAFTMQNNLYLANQGKITQITDDKNPGFVNGQIVSRNEFGIDKGIFWSPMGNKIAFYHKDESHVAEYPLVEINHRIAEVHFIRYPMAGEASEHVTLGVYDIKTGKTIFLDTDSGHFGGLNHYLTSVTWGPEGKYIYTAILNRDQNHFWMNQYDASTGRFVKTLFEEENPKYVEPLFPLYFNPENHNEFIWNSRRDGWNHLYLYNTDGKLIKQLTRGEWEVTKFLGYYPKGEVYFISTKESPIQQNIYSVSLKNTEIRRLSPVHGTHHALVSKDGHYIIDHYSNTDVSGVYDLVNNKGKILRTLVGDKDPLKGFDLGKMSIFTLKSKIDGAPLYCRMIKPTHFDSTKKYPVIVYVYGGPHDQLITDSWLGGAGLFLNYLAEDGYVVFTLDNHGSENRGRDFEQVIFRHLGTEEMKDQLVGVDYLKTLPYVDTTRMGVDGWSFGGFMTMSLFLRHPGYFKVAVAGGPVIDWKYYEVMYGERYMDTPQQNPEGYKQASLLNYVQNLHGHLLMIHGTMDPIVMWQNGLLFLKKAIDENKLVDYFVYPGQPHNVLGKDRIQLMRKIRTYFDDYLK
ncbi:MAG: S9 family peptidase [Bacteroidales bacterium]|nr:S9 family peptidase [Bacteroidales bacterium]